MEVAAKVMNTNIKMTEELRAREEREKGGEKRWTEEYEEKQQGEKTVFSPDSKTMKFEKRLVTDMKSCKRVVPPAPLSTEETCVEKQDG